MEEKKETFTATPPLKKILIADDDSDILRILNLLLTGEGYSTITAVNGSEVLEKCTNEISLIVLDINMPSMDGYTVCYELRKKYNCPILFLSAFSSDSDKSTAFLAGGDDFLSKPFSSSEFISRVKALIRRYHTYKGVSEEPPFSPFYQGTTTHIRSNNHDIYLTNDHSIVIDNRPYSLTYTEYEIVHLLLLNRGSILSASDIFCKVWGEPLTKSSTNIVTVHIQKLRKKIESNASHPTVIKTAWGRGYYIE